MIQKNILLSVVIPAFNEEELITKTLTEVESFLSERGWSHEIIVINDGSMDRTGQVVRNWSRVHPPVKLLENVQNRGKGYAVKQGVLSSRGQWILIMDADGSISVREISRLWSQGSPLDSVYDVAVGIRQKPRKGFTWMANFILGLPIKDMTCGFTCFRQEAAFEIFKRQKIERRGFEAEILFIARRKGFRIREFPVHWESAKTTNLCLFRDTLGRFLELLKIRWYQLKGYYR